MNVTVLFVKVGQVSVIVGTTGSLATPPVPPLPEVPPVPPLPVAPPVDVVPPVPLAPPVPEKPQYAGSVHTSTPLPFGAAQQPDAHSLWAKQTGRQIWLIASEMQYEPGQQSTPRPHGRVPAARHEPPQ